MSSAAPHPSPADLAVDDDLTGLSAEADSSAAGIDLGGVTPPTERTDGDDADAEEAGSEDDDTDDDADDERGDHTDLLVREGDVAADYLEQLLDIVDYDGDIDLDVENGRAIVAVVGTDLSPLVGPGGATLDALQELTRLAVQQKTGVRSRLMLDISGHRSNRRSQLSELATSTAKTVTDTGEPIHLAAMNPFERKVVHDAIAGIDGVRSESEGDEPERRVVVHPDR